MCIRDRRSVKLEFHGTDTDTDTDILADFRARILARLSVRDARVYIIMFACTVHDKLSCTRLQNYTIGASLKSVSVLVPWNSSYSLRALAARANNA